MKSRSGVLVGILAVATALTLASCSATPGTGGHAKADAGTRIAVVLTNAGCTPKATTAPAGTVTFDITNTGNGAVSELELQRDGRILAERENIAPGLTGSFFISLQPGSYQLYCPGGSGAQTHDFTVTVAASSTPAPSTTP